MKNNNITKGQKMEKIKKQTIKQMDISDLQWKLDEAIGNNKTKMIENILKELDRRGEYKTI